MTNNIKESIEKNNLLQSLMGSYTQALKQKEDIRLALRNTYDQEHDELSAHYNIVNNTQNYIMQQIKTLMESDGFNGFKHDDMLLNNEKKLQEKMKERWAELAFDDGVQRKPTIMDEILEDTANFTMKKIDFANKTMSNTVSTDDLIEHYKLREEEIKAARQKEKPDPFAVENHVIQAMLHDTEVNSLSNITFSQGIQSTNELVRNVIGELYQEPSKHYFQNSVEEGVLDPIIEEKLSSLKEDWKSYFSERQINTKIKKLSEIISEKLKEFKKNDIKDSKESISEEDYIEQEIREELSDEEINGPEMAKAKASKESIKEMCS